MKVTLLPFKYIKAITDHNTKEIFCNINETENLVENFKHELSHLCTGELDHTDKFRSMLEGLDGKQPPADDVFARFRKRLGLSSDVRLSANVGNVTGIQNVLTDLHLLASYRKFSKRILATEGHWEVTGEVDGNASQQLIRLYPTPKGSFPVVVVYYPVVNHFRSPQARMITMEMALAEAKCVLGATRRKLGSVPSPDGGNIQWDGDALMQEGEKMRDEIITKALQLGEPDRMFLF